jgi:threonine/homoserine/homoserine lactone efflux protein
MMIHGFWIFALASLMLNLTPGNDMLYVISRSLGSGVRAGILSAFGIMAGCLVHTLTAAAGLAALIAGSRSAFDLIKYAGALYLIYLGTKSLISRKKSVFDSPAKEKPDLDWKIFKQGFFTNLFNPKVALFFLAFLPQFVNVQSNHPQWQILFLGIWFDCSGTLVNILVALIFGKVGKRLAHSPKWILIQQKISGCMLIAIGIKMAMTGPKS